MAMHLKNLAKDKSIIAEMHNIYESYNIKIYFDYDNKFIIKNFTDKNVFDFNKFIKSFNEFLEVLKLDLLLLYPEIKENKFYSKIEEYFAPI
jgi:hypothetical protein